MKWEYKTIYGANDEHLNELGQDGWELVTIFFGRDFDGNEEIKMAVFKRPLSLPIVASQIPVGNTIDTRTIANPFPNSSTHDR